MSDQYFCLVDALQYIFIRNFKRSEIIKRIPLQLFPTCIKLINFSKLQLSEESAIRDLGKSQDNYLAAIGTKEGKVVVYRIAPLSHNKILQTKAGVAFGGISSLDISQKGHDMVACSESGEILQYDLLKQLNEE